MILLIDTCWKKDSLSQDEFVLPVKKISEEAGMEAEVVHYLDVDEKSVEKADKIIVCGNAMMDNNFLEQRESFAWLKTCRKPVFGICAGFEVIGLAFGGRLVDEKGIGMAEIVANDGIIGKEKLNVYELHSRSVIPEGFRPAAWKGKCVLAMKKENMYAVQFHPEVRNHGILRRWLEA